MPRGCGERQPGGVYLCTGLSPFGKPIEYFMPDPVKPLTQEDLEYLGISPIGQRIVEMEHQIIVVDWVGKKYYPHPIDFVEEARRKGISRRIAREEAKRLLRMAKRPIYMAFIHSHAAPADVPKDTPPPACYWRREDHEGGICAGHLWHTVPALEEGGTRTIGDLVYGPEIQSYDCTERPMTHVLHANPEAFRNSTAGIFLITPLTRVEVIEAPDGSHEETIKELSQGTGTIPILVAKE